jgi:hypothetical protein
VRHVRLKRDETETARTCVVLYYHPNEASVYVDATRSGRVECLILNTFASLRSCLSSLSPPSRAYRTGTNPSFRG